MKGFMNFLMIVLFIAAIFAAITNPSKEEFVDYFETQYVQNSASEGIVWEAVARITKGLAGSIADQAVRKNLVLFSIYEIDEYRYLGIYGNFILLE
jgi:hypothetical protein